MKRFLILFVVFVVLWFVARSVGVDVTPGTMSWFYTLIVTTPIGVLITNKITNRSIDNEWPNPYHRLP